MCSITAFKEVCRVHIGFHFKEFQIMVYVFRNKTSRGQYNADLDNYYTNLSKLLCVDIYGLGIRVAKRLVLKKHFVQNIQVSKLICL